MPQGDRGDDVRELQRYLNSQGANLEVDGIWGPLTQAAVDQYGMPESDSSSESGGTGGDEGFDGPRFADLPGAGEVWQDSSTGQHYVVYFVPGYEPEIPMLWAVADDMLGVLKEDEDWGIDRTFNGQDELDKAGAFNMGAADEVVLRGENPFLGWADQLEKKKEVLPWLHDPEVAAIWTSAYLEGRTPDEAELAATPWFREKTAGEQQWLSLLWSQPETAAQLEASNRLAVSQLLEQAGVMGASETIVNYIADQWTQGQWTDLQRNVQIALLADPEKAGDMDTGLQEIAAGGDFTTTIDQERFVTTEIRKWLGPVYGQWGEAEIQHWAGQIRNDPGGRDKFLNELSRQRQAVLPQYENPDLTYEDIATPWRNMSYQRWGQQIDETSDVFQQILQANDAGIAGQLLREEGLNQGVKKVEDQFLADMASSFGGGRARGYAR